MPDLDLMPPGHVLHAAPRPPAGLGDVLARAGRRRRRQRTGVVATGAAACAAVLAFSMAGGGTVDSLGVTPAHGGDGPAAHVGVEQEAPASDTTDVTQGDAGSRSGSRAEAQRPAAITGGVPRPQQPAAVASAPKPAGGEVGPPHTTTAYDATRNCDGDGPTPATGWCSYYDGATSGRPGQRVELAASICRLPGHATGRLTSDTGEQAGFAVSRGGAVRWRWGDGHTFRNASSTIVVTSGTCVRWHVSWTVTDRAGQPLPAGSYSLTARPYVADGNTTVIGNLGNVTFTVTQ